MTRRFQGLSQTATTSEQDVPDGVYLVRVEKVQHRWHARKPFYSLRLTVLEPQEWNSQIISGRLYCTAKALWKLGWFLRAISRMTLNCSDETKSTKRRCPGFAV